MMNQSKLASIMAPASRRNFIGEGGKLSALAVALLVGSERMAKGASPSPNDVGILNTALGLEYHGIAAYQVGAESKLLKPATLKVAVQFQSDHKKHADALASTIVKLGGSPVLAKTPADYNFPTSKLKTEADVLTFAAGLRTGCGFRLSRRCSRVRRQRPRQSGGKHSRQRSPAFVSLAQCARPEPRSVGLHDLSHGTSVWASRDWPGEAFQEGKGMDCFALLAMTALA